MARSIYFKPVDHGCLTDVLPGHNQILEAHFTSLDGYRQSPFHRLQTPVQTQLAEHHRTGQLVRLYLFVRRQDTDSQRQVISRSLLTALSGKPTKKNLMPLEAFTSMVTGMAESPRTDAP